MPSSPKSAWMKPPEGPLRNLILLRSCNSSRAFLAVLWSLIPVKVHISSFVNSSSTCPVRFISRHRKT